LGVQTILAMMQIIDHTLARLRYSTQSRTLAEMAMVRIATLEDLESLAELIARLRSADSSAPLAVSAHRPAQAITSVVSGAKKKAELIEPDVSSVASPRRTTESLPEDAEPPRPTTAVEVTPENVGEIWRQALSGLSGLLPEQAAACDSVSLAGADRLAVTFVEKYNSCKAFCERGEQLKTLEHALRDVVGRDIRIEFVLIKETQPQLKAARPTASRQRLNNHPLVERASELFDARVVRVEEAGGKE
jgi:DNA polymerase-3 subunit gamma/tau